jgi:ABC-type glycerol-3-phosphate transport system substrate-binding protein
MKRIFLVAVALLGIYACAKSGQPAQQANSADTLTRRQKDSIVSTMPIPGAGKIQDAQKAVDKMNEQARALDTVH